MTLCNANHANTANNSLSLIVQWVWKHRMWPDICGPHRFFLNQHLNENSHNIASQCAQWKLEREIKNNVLFKWRVGHVTAAQLFINTRIIMGDERQAYIVYEDKKIAYILAAAFIITLYYIYCVAKQRIWHFGNRIHCVYCRSWQPYKYTYKQIKSDAVYFVETIRSGLEDALHYVHHNKILWQL